METEQRSNGCGEAQVQRNARRASVMIRRTATLSGTSQGQTRRNQPQSPVQKRVFQPTYRLAPQRPLIMPSVDRHLSRMVNESVECLQQFHPRNAPIFGQRLAQEINRSMKAFQFDRFRIICIVNLVEKVNQSFVCKMGHLLDYETDRWTSCQYENESYLLHVDVFFVYML